MLLWGYDAWAGTWRETTGGRCIPGSRNARCEGPGAQWNLVHSSKWKLVWLEEHGPSWKLAVLLTWRLFKYWIVSQPCGQERCDKIERNLAQETTYQLFNHGHWPQFPHLPQWGFLLPLPPLIYKTLWMGKCLEAVQTLLLWIVLLWSPCLAFCYLRDTSVGYSEVKWLWSWLPCWRVVVN